MVGEGGREGEKIKKGGGRGVKLPRSLAMSSISLLLSMMGTPSKRERGEEGSGEKKKKKNGAYMSHFLRSIEREKEKKGGSREGGGGEEK